ncbi:MAG: DUF1080 domain-containing protein [Planctomycetales bacterium]|nr:DUF1080 domain-containing protein [Planctomycetales bacterium]
MPRNVGRILSILVVVCSWTCTTLGDDLRTVFNGKNLDGWSAGPDNSWVVENGEITLRRDFDGQEHNRDYLWIDGEFGDFVLELEFKVADNTNSGVYLRTGDRQDPVWTGIEVQVANSFGKDQLSSTGTAGAIYDCQKPASNAIKAPGEWNQYRITCRGAQLSVELNGQQVIDMNLDRWAKPNQNPDGSQNKFNTALKDFPRRGSVGFQDHGRPVWYRNVRLKEL